MGSRHLILLVVLFFFVSVVMAVPTYEQGTDITLSVPCTIDGVVCGATTTCVGTVINPEDVVLYNRENMTKVDAVFELDLNSTDTAVNGEYRFTISCTDGNSSGSRNLIFEITPNGQNNLEGINIIIFFFFLFLLVGTVYIYRNVNLKKWYNKTFDEYQNKNYFKAIMAGIGYNIMKNSFGVYYVLGFLVLLSMVDIVLIYNVESLVFWFENAIYVYAVGSILVGLMILGNLQEFIVKLMKDSKNALWGQYEKE